MLHPLHILTYTQIREPVGLGATHCTMAARLHARGLGARCHITHRASSATLCFVPRSRRMLLCLLHPARPQVSKTPPPGLLQHQGRVSRAESGRGLRGLQGLSPQILSNYSDCYASDQPERVSALNSHLSNPETLSSTENHDPGPAPRQAGAI